MQSNGEASFVPVSPNVGGSHMETSRQTFFIQSGHLGPFGGHKNKSQTTDVMKRSVQWSSIERDVGDWVESCCGCLQFRTKGRKRLTLGIVPVGLVP